MNGEVFITNNPPRLCCGQMVLATFLSIGLNSGIQVQRGEYPIFVREGRREDYRLQLGEEVPLKPGDELEVRSADGTVLYCHIVQQKYH